MKLDTKKVTLENVDAQFCSDWLKGELRRLLRKELALAHTRGVLTVIASNDNPEHSNPRFWEALGTQSISETIAEDTSQAREALAEIERILGEK